METTLTVGAVLADAVDVAAALGWAVGAVLAFAFGPRLLKMGVRLIKGK